MATQCLTQLTLSFQSKIVRDFNGGEITTDSGLLLLRQFDAQLALTKKLNGLFNDWRNPVFIEHHAKVRLAKLFVATKDEFKAALSSILLSIQRSTDLVLSFFQLPDTQYAPKAVF